MKHSLSAGQTENGNGRLALITRLAAIGGLVASVGVVAVFAFIVYITLPGAYSGLDTIESTVTWISLGLIALLVIGVNIVYARVLFAVARFPYGFPVSGKFPRS